jgi:pimeloyl-ACP methyl ester carboxylesterase
MAEETPPPGFRLAYDDHGHGEPALLCMTGWCSSRERWAEAASLLSRRRRVVNFEWRGHGDSAPAEKDFGTQEMVEDALAVVQACGIDSFVPCAASHSGWVAIELRRRLPDRVPRLVHLDWMVAALSDGYLDLLRRLQTTKHWDEARDTLFRIWRSDVDTPPIHAAIDVMKAQSADMWMRSGRVIEEAYRRHVSPLEAFAALGSPPAPVLHAYGQPRTHEYLAEQRAFSAANEWFTVTHLDTRSHFSMLESPEAAATAIEDFLAPS